MDAENLDTFISLHYLRIPNIKDKDRLKRTAANYFSAM